jgi:predicted glycosyltransferase
VLAYSHDGYGLGHLRRNLRIVSGLRAQRPDIESLLVTGARSAERLAAPFGLECVRLPPVVKVGNGHYIADGSDSSLDEVMRRRTAIIADAVRQFRPDLLLADRYPRGMRDELVPALEAHAAKQPGGAAVLGLRDILDSPRTIENEWRARGYSENVRSTYTSVLCYGDPSVFNPVAEYRLRREVAERIRFTGYLADNLLAKDPLGVRRKYCANQRRLAVCTLGGGRDAAHIAQSFMSAMERLRPRGWAGVLITGPCMTSPDSTRLRQHPLASRVPVVGMVDDLPSYLAAADAAVCMGGYNTTCELLGLGVPAVIVPRVKPRREQVMRAKRLAKRGLLRCLHPDRLSPELLADTIESAAGIRRPELAVRIDTIAHSGVRTSAGYLATLLPDHPYAEVADVHAGGRGPRPTFVGAYR